MSIPDAMEEDHNEHPNTPESSPNSSDSESPFSEPETILRTVNEPDVSLDEMLSLACRQGKLDIVQLLLQSGAQVNHRNKAGNTPLLEACSQGHVGVANYLLEHGSKIDTPTETTLDSALTWACTLGNSVIVEALLYKNADVEHRTKDGCTALMFACLAGHRDVAEKLLDAKSEVNVESDSNKDSPLTFACWKGHYDVVELLLCRNANIEHRTKEGFSPLMFAALGGHTKVARKLLECNAQVNVSSGSNNDIPLTSACWKGHRDVVKLLLEFSSNIEHRTKDGCTPLMLAAREGHIAVAELLLMNKAQVNIPSGSENNIPLTLACWKGHSEVVKLLLEYGSDIEHRNKAGCTPLMLAAREGHLKTTALLLTHNAQVNVPSGSNDDTPVTLACWKGHKDVVMLLLQSHSNVDHQTKTGCTPLMEATREGHRDVAEILLNHNADVELPDNYGQSPLFMACWKGHRNVAELLLNRFAYRDCRTKTGITPLFQACRENHVAIVELLLEYGASVNAPFPNSRENPLTLCAEKGHKILVQMLLDKGASHDCRTKKGSTPVLLASKEGHLEIVKMLANRGANMETPDCRSNTPIMAAYKNGHVQIVEWLIKLVHHLPSDELCHKILMSTVDDKEKEIVVQRRSKCLNIIQETKRKRELLALKNAQNLVQELDDEKSREEKKKTRRKEKRRDKRNKRKKNRTEDLLSSALHQNDVSENGTHEEDENDEEDIKDHIVPTENRQNDEFCPVSSSIDVLKISSMPSFPINIDLATTKDSPRKTLRKKSEKSRLKQKHIAEMNERNNSLHLDLLDEKAPIITTQSILSSSNNINSRMSPINVVNLLASELAVSSAKTSSIDWQLLKTPGICTQSTSTLGPSCSNISLPSSTPYKSSKSSYLDFQSLNGKLPSHIPVVSSIAVTTSHSITTTQADPRTDVRNITPIESFEYENDFEYEKQSEQSSTASKSDTNSENSTSSVSRNNSFDEYKESDWKEVSRTAKLLVYEMIVPNGYCGRVIGKGGKKINMITEDSGAQITIDKPPANTIPADRVITIKGIPKCVEKACQLVTLALNTPSLYTRTSDSLPPDYSEDYIKPLLNPNHTLQTQLTSKQKLPNPSEPSLQKTRPLPSKLLPSAEVSVTPLVTYRQVATGAVSLEDIQKQLQSRSTDSQAAFIQASTAIVTSDTINSHDRTIPMPVTSAASTQLSEHYTSHAPPLTTISQFSYFTQTEQKDIPDPNKQMKRKSLSSITDLSSNNATNRPTNIYDDSDIGAFDRGRSFSLSGNLKSNESSTAQEIRSVSTDAINIQEALHPCSNYANHVDLNTQGYTPDENIWSTCNMKQEGTISNSYGDRWEISSSPTSSISSSKVELTNILNDNDSGVGGSNPLGPTPVSEQDEPHLNLNEPSYIDSTMENSPWLRNRGAYSAPSSPALQRNIDNNTIKTSQKNINIRSQLSMENLNYEITWNQSALHNEESWNGMKFDKKLEDSSENRDSALSSPRSNTERGVSSPRSSFDRNAKYNSHEILEQQTQTALTNNAKPWSAERFQDVHSLTDLLSQLSLDKYSTTLQEKGITLESVITLTEKDLQTFDVPKGPRLKILKACEVIKAQKYLKDQSNQLLLNNIYHPLPSSRSYSHQSQASVVDKSQLSKDQVYSSGLHFPEFALGCAVQQHPSFNMMYANTQFVYPPPYSQNNITQSLYQSPDDFVQQPPPPPGQVNINQVPQSQPVVPSQHPAYIYQDNPAACYFYSTPQ